MSHLQIFFLTMNGIFNVFCHNAVQGKYKLIFSLNAVNLRLISHLKNGSVKKSRKIDLNSVILKAFQDSKLK